MIELALTTNDRNISFDLLKSVARTLNRDLVGFGVLWNVQAYVTAYPEIKSLPTGGVIPSNMWPMIVVNNLTPDELGIHLDDSKGTPYALIEGNPNWSITASHEMHEMIVDPLGQRIIQAPSIKPDDLGKLVNYLEEPDDPCEAISRRNGPYLISDSVLPSWYDGVRSGIGYDRYGKITLPRTLLEGGYVSWMDIQTEHWWQAFMVFGQLEFSDLGTITARDSSGKRLPEVLNKHIMMTTRSH